MERTVLMMYPEQKAKLDILAKEEHVSVAEINRRAIDAYGPHAANDVRDLEKLAEFVLQSHAEVEEALKDAHKAVRGTLSHFASSKKRRQDAVRRDAIYRVS